MNTCRAAVELPGELRCRIVYFPLQLSPSFTVSGRAQRLAADGSRPLRRRCVSSAAWLSIGLAFWVTGANWVAGQTTPVTPDVVLRGHFGAVTWAEFTPDGEKIVTASSDETAGLWSAADGKLIRTFTGHTGPIYCLAISGNGRWLATGAQDNTVRLWDIPQTRPLQWLEAHPGGVTAIAQTADGQMVATVGNDQKLRIELLLAAAQVAEVSQRPGHTALPSSVAVRPDGMQLASGDESGNVLLWSPYLESPQFQLAGHAGRVTSIAFLNDNQRWVTAGRDGLIKLWQQPLNLPRFDAMPEAVTGLVIVPNQPVALVAGRDSKLRWLDIDQAKTVRELQLANPPTALAVSNDGAHVAVGLQSGQVSLVRQSDGVELFRIGAHDGPVAQLVFHADNQRFWSVGEDGWVRLWRLPIPPTSLSGHGQMVTALAASTDNAFWATASQDQSVRIWNAQGQPVRAITAHQAPVTGLALRPDNAWTASGDATGQIIFSQVSDGQPVGRLWAAAEPIVALAYSADGQGLVSLSVDGSFRRWQAPSPPRMLNGHGAPVRDLATCQADLVLTGSADQTVRLWRPSDGQPVRQLDAQTGPVVAVALTSDGRIGAAVGENGAVEVWRTSDGARLARWMHPTGRAKDVVLLPSGEWLFTIDADNMLRRWAVPKEPVAQPTDLAPPEVIALPAGTATALAVGPHAKSIYVGTDGGAVLAWDLETHQWRQPVTGAAGSIVALDVSDRAQCVVAGSSDGHAYVWNLADQSEPRAVWQKLAHGVPLRAVAVAVEGRWLATVADDGFTRVWNLNDGALWERLGGVPTPVHAVAFAGAQLAIAGAENTVRIVSRSAVARWAVPPDRKVASWSLAEPHIFWCDGKSPHIEAMSWDGVAEGSFRADGQTPLTRLSVHRPSGTLAAVDSQGGLEIWSTSDRQRKSRRQLGWQPTALAISPDGRWVAVAGANRIVAYAVHGLEFVEEIIASALPSIEQLAWSADGQWVAASGTDPTVQLYRWNRLGAKKLFEPLQQATYALAAWGNRDTVAVGGPNGKVSLVQAGALDAPAIFLELPQAITALAATSDGGRLLVATADGRVSIVNSADKQTVCQWQVSEPARWAMFSPDNQRVAVALAGGVVEVHETASGLAWEYFRGHTGWASVNWLPDNRTLVSAGADRTIRLWSLNVQRAAVAHEGGVVAMALFAGGGQCATLGATGPLRLWNTADLSAVREIPLPSPATAVAVRADNQRIATGSSDGSVYLWNANNGEAIAKFPLSGPITALAFSPDNQKLAASTGDRLYLLAVPNPPQQGVEYQVHQELVSQSPCTCLVFMSDNRTVRAGHASGHVSLWSYASPQPLRQFNHGGPVFGVALNDDGTVLVSASADQTVRIWDAQSGQQRAQLGGHQGAVYGLVLTRDAALAVSSGADRTLRLWDVLGGRQLKQLATLPETAYVVAVHPSAPTLAAGGADRKIHFLDLLTGNEQRVLEGHTDFVHSVAFNPQGTRLLTYGYSGQLIVWNAADGQKVWQTRIGHVGNTARYAPDGQRVVLANGDGTACIVTLPAEAR